MKYTIPVGRVWNGDLWKHCTSRKSMKWRLRKYTVPDETHSTSRKYMKWKTFMKYTVPVEEYEMNFTKYTVPVGRVWNEELDVYTVPVESMK